MVTVYLSLGSNIDREQNIRSALDALAAHFGSLQLSSVYESESVGFDGDAFYNLVAALQTEMSLEQLARLLRQIEADHGRSRGEQKFSDRTLDIDILTYGDCVGDIAGIVLPRDEICKYAFVLQPLAEIASDVKLPGGNQSYAELWQSFERCGPDLWPVPFTWRQQQLPVTAGS